VIDAGVISRGEKKLKKKNKNFVNKKKFAAKKKKM
jgi:hypothetical protein